MQRNDSKRMIKIDVKAMKPKEVCRTPVYSQCLTERNLNIISPEANLKISNTERKTVSIDMHTAAQKQASQGKKVVRMRRKADSSDLLSTKQGTKATISRCSSDRKIVKKKSILSSRQHIVKCFDGTYTADSQQSRQSGDRDWEDIIKSKKNQLYSHLYKMDKKIFVFEQELQKGEVHGKKEMMNIIKKKMQQNTENNQALEHGQISTKRLSSNIYKISRLKGSNYENLIKRE